MASPNLGFAYLVEGQSSAEVTLNEALNRIDMLLHLTVIDRDLTAPPGSESNGDVYLVLATGTGTWAGHDGDIAGYYDGYIFQTPFEGMRMYVADEDLFMVYDGTTWDTVTVT